MNRLGGVLMIGLFCLGFPWRPALGGDPPAADTGTAPSQTAPPAPERDEGLELKQFHAGALFLLNHYAMLESCITANEQGRPENQAFWIGGASMAIPGAGQMINKDYLQGSLLLYTGMLSWATLQQAERKPEAMVAKKSHLLPWYYSSLVLRNLIMSYAMLHAANARYRDHHDRTAAMWTGAASVLPGVGQAVNGDWWEAGGFLAGWVLFAGITSALEHELFAPRDAAEGITYSVERVRCSLAMLPDGCGLMISSEW